MKILCGYFKFQELVLKLLGILKYYKLFAIDVNKLKIRINYVDYKI